MSASKVMITDARFGMLSCLIYTNVWNAITLVRPVKEVLDSSSTHTLMLPNKMHNQTPPIHVYSMYHYHGYLVDIQGAHHRLQSQGQVAILEQYY